MFNCRSYLKNVEKLSLTEEGINNDDDDPEGCNLDDEDEESSKVKLSNHRKAMLSLEKILDAVRRETTVLYS